jgi:hypothetical protein
MKNCGKKRFWQKMLALAGVVGAVACVSVKGPQVLERSDNLAAAPTWVRLDQPAESPPGRMQFLGLVTVPGDSSKSAALNMADEKALSEPMRAIVSAFLDQNQVGEDMRIQDQVGQRIISATRTMRPAMPTLRIARRYWETRSAVDPSSGEVIYQLHAWAQAELEEADFTRARREYLSQLRGDPKIRAILDEVGRAQRESSGAEE